MSILTITMALALIGPPNSPTSSIEYASLADCKAVHKNCITYRKPYAKMVEVYDLYNNYNRDGLSWVQVKYGTFHSKEDCATYSTRMFNTLVHQYSRCIKRNEVTPLN